MNTDVFFENFEFLADVPNGVQKLRELILQLVVMGKLVPQDQNDETASELFEKIKEEKEKLVRENKIKKFEYLPSIDEDKLPHNLPENWKWVRIDEICFQVTDGVHSTPTYISNGIPFLSVNNLRGNKLSFENCKYIPLETHNELIKRCKPEKYDLLLGKVGSIGVCDVINTEQEFSIFVQLALLKPAKNLVDSNYIKYAILSRMVQEQLLLGSAGSALQYIGIGKIQSIIFPLPPLAEQKRIVSKVDELMALCDKLEARRQKKQEIQSKLNSAALDRMLSAENQEEFEQHWQRICENFDLLYDNPENVDKLKQAILQLAVQGKLVTQNPEDEPASILIEKVRNEREKLGKEGKIKKNESFLEIETGEMPYDLPERWEWVRLGNLCELITKGSSPKWQGVSYVEKSNGILFITSENVGNYSVNLDKEKYVEQKFNEIEPRSILKRKDILMNIVGASIGRTAIYESDEVANINQAVCLIRVIGQDKLVSLRYLLHFFNSPTCISYMFDKQVDNARANLSMGNISKFVIPLPPLAEQKHIVEKVEQLIGLCGELEAKLRKEREDNEKLMEAVVKGLLEGTVTEKPELETPIPLQIAAIKLK